MNFKRVNYQPLNPKKYTGKYPIVLKSGWEEDFVRRNCDLNPSCISWNYEPWSIPYFDPITGSQKVYMPDLLMTYATKAGGTKTTLVEIKPIREYLAGYAETRQHAMVQARNMAKFKAAIAWCMRRGIEFKVITEAQMYGVKKPPRKRAIRPFGAPKRTVKRTRK